VNHQDVALQMLSAGLDAPAQPLDTTGRVVRFGPKKAHWYVLREHRTGAGNYVVTGSFGNHRGQERWRVDVDWAGIGQAERDELEQRRVAQRAADVAARARLAELAAMNAADLWSVAARVGRSAYLERKGVDAEACRYLPDGSIVIPLLRYDAAREDALRAVQTIAPDGSKRFTRGLQKPGVCLRLGHVVVGEPLLVCEGYATGLSLRMALDRRLPVFVALDAGNLLPTVELLHALHPRNNILICADDDFRTPGNPGREKAHKASRAVDRCNYVYPIFMPRNRGAKDTDFNDLHLREGLVCVRRQLRHVLPIIGSEMLNAA
jgi:putative DNA primase/helicase